MTRGMRDEEEKKDRWASDGKLAGNFGATLSLVKPWKLDEIREGRKGRRVGSRKQNRTRSCTNISFFNKITYLYHAA